MRWIDPGGRREIEEAGMLVAGRLRGVGVLGRRLSAIEVSGIATNGLNSTGRYSPVEHTTSGFGEVEMEGSGSVEDFMVRT
jgi:hypothetical protein